MLHAAEELGYVLSMTARGAACLNRTMTIGVVLGFITDELFLRITRGVQSVAYERGYTLLIGDTEQDPQLESRILEQFRQHQVDGLIFVDTWRDPGMFLALERDQYPPMAFATLRQTMTPHNCVGVDNVQGGYEADAGAICLTWAGARSPTSAGRNSGSRPRSACRGTVRRLTSTACRMMPPRNGRLGDCRRRVAALDRLLDRRPDIEAVFASNDLMVKPAVSRPLPGGVCAFLTIWLSSATMIAGWRKL